MDAFLFWLAVVTLVLTAATAIEFAVGNRSCRWLKDLPPLPGDKSPRVSVIVAARNEARKIEESLRSLLRQDYPNLELIVVDDRSTDDTGAILDRMVKTDPHLRILHLNELPKGWLGKNHAHHAGAERATGEFLLFTDADIWMAPSAISRAVNFLVTEKVDHVPVAPQLTMPGMLLDMFAGAFTLFFGMYAKPWKARDPKSSRHVGIGAFNLLRADVYRTVGGHRPIALRPDDDMKLGKLVKKGGHRQEVVLGDGFVRVEWYSSFRELMVGLEKNSFAGVEYNLAVLIIASILQWTVFVWPLCALFLTSGATLWLNAASLLVTAALYADNARFHGLKSRHFFGFPLCVALFQFILWRATLKTLINDGINWRDTHYSLAELKSNKV